MDMPGACLQPRVLNYGETICHQNGESTFLSGSPRWSTKKIIIGVDLERLEHFVRRILAPRLYFRPHVVLFFERESVVLFGAVAGVLRAGLPDPGRTALQPAQGTPGSWSGVWSGCNTQSEVYAHGTPSLTDVIYGLDAIDNRMAGWAKTQTRPFSTHLHSATYGALWHTSATPPRDRWETALITAGLNKFLTHLQTFRIIFLPFQAL